MRYFILLGSKITTDNDCSQEIKKYLLLGRKVMTNLDSLLKSRDIILLTEVLLIKAVFSSSHVLMWELDHKEGWVLKNWCFWSVVLEKTLESPLDSKEIKPVNPKGNKIWTLIGRTDAEAKAPILWPPDAQNRFIGKGPDAGKNREQERKEQQRMRRLDGFNRQEFVCRHTSKKPPGDSEGKGSLLWCGPWGC